MKEIVTGSCLIAIAVLMSMLFVAHISNDYAADRKVGAAVFGLALFVVAVAFGFSGCGIFIRGVFR